MFGTLSIDCEENMGISGPFGSRGNSPEAIMMTGGTVRYGTTVPTIDISQRFSTSGSQQFKIDTNGRDVTFASQISGASSKLWKYGLGTLVLSGDNTFTGGVDINDGTVLLQRTQSGSASGPVGVAGPILFSGGWIKYSEVNSFDYSARMSVKSGQSIKIHTNGQNVAFQTGLISSDSSLFKDGAGSST